MNPSLAQRFEKYTIPEPNSGCLLWLGAPTGPMGHGQLSVSGKNRMASHIALELAGRPLPPGMFACHTCDNPSCVEETHLFHGTQKDNVRDAISKGRFNTTGLGAAHGYNSHPAEVKAAAKILFETIGAKPRRISRELGISVGAVADWLKEFGHKTRGAPPYTSCKYGHEFPPGRTSECLVCKKERRRRYAAD